MANSILDLLVKLTLDDSELSSGLNKVKSGIGGVMGGVAKATVAATAAATTAVVGMGAASVKTGAEFDKSMSQVAATMGKSVDEIENLRDFAQEMGRTTAFSATQAADALNYMALAGYDAETSIGMLPNVLNLAAAGDMDLARASDMVTDTQTAFGISLDRTSQMVDEMAKAASTGNTSVEQLGDAFLTVGGLAAELNGGMVTLADGTQKPVDGVQELEIALTAMANAGVKGSEAGTHMRNMLLKLSSPTSDGTKALEEMGVAVFDTEGKMRSLSDIFGDLNDNLGNMTQEQKIQTISDLFNTRDLASAEALLGAVDEDWDKIGESILGAEGAASKMKDTQLNNLAGDITLFKSALEGAQIAISDTLTPSLREFVRFGTDGLSRLTEAFQNGGMEGAMTTFGEILSDGLNAIIEKLPDYVQAGMDLLGALGKGLLDNLPAITDAAGKVIIQLVSGLIEALPNLVEGAIQIIGQLATFLGEQFPTLIPKVVEMILAITEALIDNVDLLVDGAIALTTGLAEGIINSLPILIEKAPEIIQKLIDAIVENAPELIVASAEIVIKLVEGIITNLPQLVQSGTEIVISIVTGLVSSLFKLTEAGSQIMDEIKFAIDAFDPVKWGADMLDKFVQGIKGGIGKVKDAAKSVADSVKNILGFSEPKEGPLSNFHTFAPDMMDLFAQGIKDNEKELQNTVSDAFDFGNQIIGGVSTNLPISTLGTGSLPTTAGRDLTVILELEKTQLAKTIYRMNNEETQRVGVRLAGGVV